MLEAFDLLLTKSDLLITQKKVERTVLPECEIMIVSRWFLSFPTVYLWLGGL